LHLHSFDRQVARRLAKQQDRQRAEVMTDQGPVRLRVANFRKEILRKRMVKDGDLLHTGSRLPRLVTDTHIAVEDVRRRKSAADRFGDLHFADALPVSVNCQPCTDRRQSAGVEINDDEVKLGIHACDLGATRGDRGRRHGAGGIRFGDRLRLLSRTPSQNRKEQNAEDRFHNEIKVMARPA
jgi:hypothetical protein